MKLADYDRSKLLSYDDDLVLQFIDEMLDNFDPRAQTPAHMLYEAFCLWTKTPMTQQTFGKLMGKHFEKVRIPSGTIYLGVTLVEGAFIGIDTGKEPVRPPRLTPLVTE